MLKNHKPEFEVWPENWQAVELFLMCGTQWKIAAGMSGGQYLGLDYSAVIEVIRLHVKKRKRQQQVFSEIQCIESGALEAMNKNGAKS